MKPPWMKAGTQRSRDINTLSGSKEPLFLCEERRDPMIVYLDKSLWIYLLAGMFVAGIVAYLGYQIGMSEKEYWTMIRTCIFCVFFWPAVIVFTAVSMIEWISYELKLKLSDGRRKKGMDQNAESM